MIGIKGVKMPKDCAHCPCRWEWFNECDEQNYCQAVKDKVQGASGIVFDYEREIPDEEMYTMRQPWCPLVEIEEGDKNGPVED